VERLRAGLWKIPEGVLEAVCDGTDMHGCMGWQFTAAEFVGGPIMIVVLAVLFRLFLREILLRQAREQADQALAGSMEGRDPAGHS
jgi:hypothetical protein